MLSYLLELFAFSLVSAAKSPAAERVIVDLLNPLYVWLLSMGL